MTVEDLNARIAEKIARKREKIAEKVEKAQEKKVDLEARIADLEAELADLEAEIEALVEPQPGERERLGGQRERLLAKKESLLWRIESVETRIEALSAAMDSLEGTWTPPIPPRPPRPPFPGAPGASQRSTRQQEEERLKILQMVSEGKISAEDAAKLLEALGSGGRAARATSTHPRVVRVRVTDLNSGASRVNITLPLGFLRSALRRGVRASADINVGGVTLDAEELESVINSGMLGHLIDIVDDEEGERVEVVIE